MNILFFTDPHLGINRLSHTTVESRSRLKESTYRMAYSISNWAAHGPKFCLGDLFDSDTNNEAVIAQGADILKSGVNVLAGNHDLPNREGKLSSLQLLAHAVTKSAVSGDVYLPAQFVQSVRIARTNIYLVPHQISQEVFEQVLQETKEKAKGRSQTESAILCLHCNYDNPYEHTDASLNLTPEQAEDLLTVFDHVLIGHEHSSRMLHNGRLILLGNTHPTSFSDISDKYYWVYDTDTSTFSQYLCWGKQERYRRLSWEELLSTDIDPVWPDLQFVEVFGSAPAGQLPEVAGAVAKLWKTIPSLLMLKNSVVAIGEEADAKEVAHKALDLPEKVTLALEGTSMLTTWKHYLEKLND